MSAESEFFLGSKSSVVLLETLEILHPNFINPFRIVRNVTTGLTANAPDKGGLMTFVYYPLKISRIGVQQNMDQGFNITVGDVGDTLVNELDRIESASNFAVKPTVIYRAWRSDHLSEPIYGPIQLEITNINVAAESATFEASAPRININGTGELYTLNRFPMLRGSL